MRKDAEAHADEDKRKREEVEVRNDADNAVYRSEKMLKDSGDKIPAGERSKVEAAMTGVKDALKGGDTAAIKTATEKLNEAWQTASTELYKQASEKAQAGRAQSAPGAGGPQTETQSSGTGGAGKDEGPIIDAEVVDEKK
jgi:molecular chaperone DnaK